MVFNKLKRIKKGEWPQKYDHVLNLFVHVKRSKCGAEISRQQSHSKFDPGPWSLL